MLGAVDKTGLWQESWRRWENDSMAAESSLSNSANESERAKSVCSVEDDKAFEEDGWESTNREVREIESAARRKSAGKSPICIASSTCSSKKESKSWAVSNSWGETVTFAIQVLRELKESVTVEKTVRMLAVPSPAGRVE
jgi:hypothetical protein